MGQNNLQVFAAQERRVRELNGLVQHVTAQNAKLAQIVTAQHEASRAQDRRISLLTAGLTSLAQVLGPDTNAHVRTAMAKAAGLIKQADEQNPAQPVPEPAPEPPTQTSVDAKTPEAFADVQAPGLVPGTTNDVAPDVTTTVFTPGADIPDRGFTQLVDVTRPIEGTQGPLPVNQVRTEGEVRVGNPMNPATAYPLDGTFAQPMRVGASLEGETPEPTPMEQAQRRLFAAQASAKIQIQAGVADTDDETELTRRIVASADTVEEIERETDTFTRAHAAHQRMASQRVVTPPRGIVPRAASGVARVMPPLAESGMRGGGSSGQQVFTKEASYEVPAGYNPADDDLSAMLI